MENNNTTAAERLRDPAVYRLSVYVVAGIIGLVLVATGALEANGVAAWVERASTQAGGLLAIIAGLAAKNVDKSGAPDAVIEVDSAEVAETLAPDIIATIRDNVAPQIDAAQIDARERAGDVLAAMRARIEAARAGDRR